MALLADIPGAFGRQAGFDEDDLTKDTFAFHRALTSQRPKRPDLRARPVRQQPLEYIFEDEPEGPLPKNEGLRAKPIRPLAHASIAANTGRNEPTKTRLSDVHRLGYDPSEQPKQESEKNEKGVSRRRTIWIPDDTTVMSIHPGAKQSEGTATRLDPTIQAAFDFSLPNTTDQPRLNSYRKSILAPPRRLRAPLKTSLQPVQEHAIVIDRPGRPTGKENVPPGWHSSSDGKHKAALATVSPKSSQQPVKIMPEPRKRQKQTPQPVEIQEESAKRATSRIMTQSSPAQVKERTPELKASLNRPSRPTVKQYPVTKVDILNPSMFQDSWLLDQEVAITNLVNSVLEGRTAEAAAMDPSRLRRKLMKIYQSKETSTLFKRLQASLSFGAISFPSDDHNAKEAARFVSDLGVRKNFIRLWTTTYDHELLSAGLEAVIGRQITRSKDGLTTKAQDLVAFIQSCLLLNEDADFEQAKAFQDLGWGWKRTMQRSLLLIHLLDEAKNNGVWSSTIFRKGSSQTSSQSVLSVFAKLLMPWVSDVSRHLSHLQYNLHYSQHPLAHFDDQISNLAVDLRDGVRLAGLVESILWPAEKVLAERTLTLLDGDTIILGPSRASLGPLTQHVKYPCLTRVHKIFNVQLTLSALIEDGKYQKIANSISASDIVDGHREKTLALLWTLVIEENLDSVLNLADLKAEILRIDSEGATTKEEDSVSPKINPTSNDGKQILRTWAQCVAAKNEIDCTNDSTSYADGKIFEAIVDEYFPYFVLPDGKSRPKTLEQKLLAVKCSMTFTKTFARISSSMVFTSAEFTLAALAFLASKLLSATKTKRYLVLSARKCARACAAVVQEKERLLNAALVLQRIWRGYSARKFYRLEKGGDVWLEV